MLFNANPHLFKVTDTSISLQSIGFEAHFLNNYIQPKNSPISECRFPNAKVFREID